MDDNKSAQRQSLGRTLVDLLKNNIRQYTMIIALLVIWAIFAILTKGTFLTARNLSILFMQMCTVGILTGGMVLVMVSGKIDLSVGMVVGTLGAAAAYMMIKLRMNAVLAILITLALGLIVGLWQGFWIAYRDVPAFIVTLSSQIAFRGFMLAITGGATIGGFGAFFVAIGQGYVPSLLPESKLHSTTLILAIIAVLVFVVMEIRTRRERLKNGFSVMPIPLQVAKMVLISAAIAALGLVLASYRGLPIAILILLAIVGIFTVLANRTSFGRHVYAIGGNREAALLSGINTRRTNLGIFVLMGLLCGVASLVYTARLNAATAAAGNMLETDTIAACIIGGTSTMGGIGTIFGAIIGALVMASLDNGMSLMNLPIMIQYIVKGIILLLAVWVDIATKKRG